MELGAGVEYRVQLEDETGDYQRINDAIAAVDAGENDEQLLLQELQEEGEWRSTTAPAAVAAVHCRAAVAVSEYDRLRLRAQHKFEQATEQMRRTVASGQRTSVTATSTAAATPTATTTTVTAARTGTRSLSSLSSLPLSDWLSTGRPLPLRSANELAWQRELQCQSLMSGGDFTVEQAAKAGVSLSNVVVRAASYRQALSDLSVAMSSMAKPLSPADRDDRSDVDVTVQRMQQQYQQVTTHVRRLATLTRHTSRTAHWPVALPPIFCLRNS